MALLDLSLVTQALITLLEKHISASPAWTSGTAPKISPQPPDQLTEDSLGFYLIHIDEDPHFKSQPPVGSTAPPIRYTPMGLQLTYQVTAHSTSPGKQSSLNEQLLLGLAMKALHDYPVIDDDTAILPKTGPPAVKVFPTDLQGHGNLIRISLLTTPLSEAASLWTGQNEPPRIALYYQVSVVMLEPDKLRSRSGRVLRYGVQTFVSGAPQLDGSRNTLTVVPPGEPPMPLVLSPAVAPAAAPAGPTDEATVRFTGANLVGDETTLSLIGAQWPDIVDTGWPVFATDGEAQVVLRETLSGPSGPLSVLPGVYSARVVVKRRRQMPDGSVRVFPQTSNATPFLISPRIDSITSAAGLWTVTGGLFAELDSTAPPVIPDAREVHVGARQLKEVSGPLGPGQFQVVDPHTLKLQLPAGLPSGPTPFKVIVRGAESPPRWIEVP